VVLVDERLPDGHGLDLVASIRREFPELPVVVLNSTGSARVAIDAMKMGALDCLRKPLDVSVLRRLVASARGMSQSRTEGRSWPLVAGKADDWLAGECESMQRVFKAIGRLANREDPVLLTGEAGTGKETVARAIHAHSDRASRPLEVCYCHGLTEVELVSKLAVLARPVEANPAAGTLYLQEIAAIPLSAQTQLIEWHNDRQRHNQAARSHDGWRMIVGSSIDLAALVSAGRFRPDLFYALSAQSIHLPALRDRPGDLPILVRGLLAGWQRDEVRIADEAMRHLSSYMWPGNLDELQSVLKRCLAEGDGRVLVTQPWYDHVCREAAIATANGEATATTNWQSFVTSRLQSESVDLYAEAVAEAEAKLLPLVLSHTQGNQAQAARILGITRASLRKKIRTLRLELAGWVKRRRRAGPP
jgi:two-component system nitrogen regulation response regulator GlnG